MTIEASAEREGQVLQQLNRLETSLDRLHSSIDVLEKRLSWGVLRPAGPSTPENVRKDEEPMVGLAAKLREKTYSVSDADQHIKSILERLEI